MNDLDLARGVRARVVVARVLVVEHQCVDTADFHARVEPRVEATRAADSRADARQVDRVVRGEQLAGEGVNGTVLEDLPAVLTQRIGRFGRRVRQRAQSVDAVVEHPRRGAVGTDIHVAAAIGVIVEWDWIIVLDAHDGEHARLVGTERGDLHGWAGEPHAVRCKHGAVVVLGIEGAAVRNVRPVLVGVM